MISPSPADPTLGPDDGPKTRPSLSRCARFGSRAFADACLLTLSRLPLALMLQPSGAMSMLRSWRRWWRALAAAATL